MHRYSRCAQWRLAPIRLVAALARQILNQTNDERGPAGLMIRAQPATGIAIEVLVKEHEIAPMRVRRPARISAVHGSPAVRVSQKQGRDATREIARDLEQRREA